MNHAIHSTELVRTGLVTARQLQWWATMPAQRLRMAANLREIVAVKKIVKVPGHIKRLLVSFSGGQTSAYMARILQEEFDGELRFVIANTGCEDERTLVFADRCDREWGLNLVWIGAVVHHDVEIGSTHRIVDFSSASREGEPFKEVIKKYGIPNKKYPHCTRELKTNPIRSYMREIGWGEELTAIGIRADEPDRVSDVSKYRLVYPLAHWFPTSKREINDWWEDQPFQLGLYGYEGNCTWCWKKSLTKLLRIAKEHPERFAFPLRMEQEYGLDRNGNRTTFFREKRSAQDIIAIAELVKPQLRLFHDDPDADDGCSESCEVFMEAA